MVTVAALGNVFPDHSLASNNIAMMIAVHESHYQPPSSVPRSRDRDALSTPRPPSSSPRPAAPASSASIANSQSQTPGRYGRTERNTSSSSAPSSAFQDRSKPPSPSHRRPAPDTAVPSKPARLPSPPPSSASEPSSSDTQPQPDPHRHTTTTNPPPPASFTTSESNLSASSTSTDATVVAAPGSRSIPSPGPDRGPRWTPSLTGPAPPLSLPPLDNAPVQTQTTIRVRDLEHVQSLAHSDLLNGHGSNSINDPPLQQLKFDISGMPICDIIEMVAALLTKITSTNDLQHDALNRNAHHLRQAQAQARASADGSGDASSMSPLSSSVLAFHGKNVPAITILSYLTRIHKYCPTTFEVFLSLLVYFDRMTERVNDLVMKSEEERRRKLQEQLRQQAQQAKREEAQRLKRQSRTAAERAEGEAAKDGEDTIMRDRDDEQDQQEEEMDDASSNATETDSDLADSTDDGDEGTEATDATAATKSAAAGSSPHATYFVVDSFNIHRLIIAGVTCASKFFSDVFYTNSRYAKVGGLPLPELNHLELQFLLLNDFRLAVPVEDLEAYATMLVEFYAREVVGPSSEGKRRMKLVP
ncbi:hypothetical protein VTJ04DRAFT_10562 [Mycothermus thermophilus]|uniref:uncharacterized protein n=1 Tax=Humicola insolens TaxID=85995 RepID=UPI003742E729